MPIQKYREPVRAISGGTVYAGAWLMVFDEDEELAAIFADAERTTRLPNPIRADAAGYFPPIYVDPDADHRCVLVDAAGDEIFDVEALGERALLSVSDEDPRDAAGAPLPLATRTFFAARTTELATVFADDGFTTPLPNPVAADENGEFPDIYLPPGEYRVQLHAAPGNPAFPPLDLSHAAKKAYIGGPLIYDVELGAGRFYPLRYGVLGVVRTVFTPAGGGTGDEQTWVKPSGVEKVLVLAVGGGGDAHVTGNAGSVTAGGGGGGGQVRIEHEVAVSGNVTVRVPDTHIGIPQDVPTRFGDLLAVRGGGWHYQDNCQDGASGAGAAVRSTIEIMGVIVQPGVSNVSPRQGSGGGAWYSGGNGGVGFAGGGGGAGGPGGSAVPIGIEGAGGGAGGPGVYVGDIIGDDLGDDGWFGGGGGGAAGASSGYPAGAGGKGGGAAGTVNGVVNGTSGTGGGGGGRVSTTPVDSRGGGGIVVVLHYDPAVHGPGYWPY